MVDAIAGGATGGGATTITVSGAITGGRYGIGLGSTSDTEINIAATAVVTGATVAIHTDYNSTNSNDTINLSGTLNGNVILGGGDDIFRLYSGGTLGATTTNIDGGANNDAFILAGDGDGTLDGGVHSNFETFEKTGAGTWSLTGTHNFATSSLISGGTLDLQGTLVSALLTNNATLAIGGVGTIGTGTITGNLTQSATGTFAVDVNLDTNKADKLTVSGTANLAGKVLPTITGSVTGTEQFTVITAAGGAINSGLTVDDTVGFDLGLLFSGNNVILTVEEALTVLEALETNGSKNQEAIAAFLDNLKKSGDVSDDILALITGLLALPSDAALAAALNNLLPSSITGQFRQFRFWATSPSAMPPCHAVSQRVPTPSLPRASAFGPRSRGAIKNMTPPAAPLALKNALAAYRAVRSLTLGGELRVGLALNYERSETKIGNLAETDGKRVQGWRDHQEPLGRHHIGSGLHRRHWLA